jgi:hypothetical protein
MRRAYAARNGSFCAKMIFERRELFLHGNIR